MSLFGFNAVTVPDPRQLQAGASHLRLTAQVLGGRRAQVTAFADAIGPGLWSDQHSAAAKVELGALADNMNTGQQAMTKAAEALEQAAAVVAGNLGRHADLTRQLTAIEPTVNSAQATESAQQFLVLQAEQTSIEAQIRSAMAQAADVIDRAAAQAHLANDSQGGVLTVLGALGRGAFDVLKGAGDLVSGVWDGTAGLVTGLVSTALSLGELAVKLSPERALIDPAGYEKDLSHFGSSVGEFAGAIERDPVGVLKAVGEGVIDYNDLIHNPVHWVGEMVPNAVSFLVGGEAVDAVKGADMIDGSAAIRLVDTGAEARARAAIGTPADVAARAAAGQLMPIDELPADLLRRYEGQPAIWAQQGAHTLAYHTNGTGLSDVEYLQTQRHIQDVTIPGTAPTLAKRPADGIFTSYDVANQTIRNALLSKQAEINRWLSDPSDPDFSRGKSWEYTAPTPVGISIERGQATMPPFETNLVQIVVKKTDSMPEGFLVQTAFPKYNFGR